MCIQKRLRSARTHAGFPSAAQAAKALGVNPRTYSRHESGSRDFDRETALIYARRFGVRVEWLLLGTGAIRAGEDDVLTCAGDFVPDSPADVSGPLRDGAYDPVIFAEASEMVQTFKRDLGFRFVSTLDYLRLIDTFYSQAHAARQNISH